MQTFTLAFLTALTLATATKLWLGMRHLSHIQRHRDSVPAEFANDISLDAHHRAADYSRAKSRLALISIAFECAVILLLTFGGGLQLLQDFTAGWFAPGIARGVALIVLLATVMMVIEIPFGWYSAFGIEQRFGFNKMTPLLFCVDSLKHGALAAALGIPLVACVLWVMEQSGERWWLYAWLIWVAFNLFLLAVYPTWIAPLFNKFSPLDDPQLKGRIERLIEKCGFKVQGLMVMDGSRRSSHGNAYFTGFGKTKRIVFFDTLLSRLGPGEIEAVLAHELGHFKLKHVVKRIAWIFAASLAFLWLLAQLMSQTWFYTGLNVQMSVQSPSTAMALILFSIVVPPFIFLLQPVTSFYSRKHEFEADEYAVQHASVTDLISALVKLYKDNATTLTPDPLHSAFYDSHPPATLRIARLKPVIGHELQITNHRTLMTAADLAHQKCKPCEGGVAPLMPQEIARLLQQLDGWEYRDGVITKTYEFRDYYQTMAFVNAVAWISHREDHHPDMRVGYNKCRVDYSTHAIAGLSENDFICAAKLDALFSL